MHLGSECVRADVMADGAFVFLHWSPRARTCAQINLRLIYHSVTVLQCNAECRAVALVVTMARTQATERSVVVFFVCCASK